MLAALKKKLSIQPSQGVSPHAKLQFESGAEYWEASYFHTQSGCISNDDLLNNFGKKLAQDLNNQKEKICNDLHALVSEHYRDTFPVSWETDDCCFSEGKIDFDEENKYIIFPSFKIRELKDFELRIRINPCVSLRSTQTKIYCIPKYLKEIDSQRAIVFFDNSKLVCSKIINNVSKIYQTTFNKFATIGTKEIESMGNPSKLRFFAVGSSLFKNLIEHSSQKDLLVDYCKLTTDGKNIHNFINDSAKLVDEKLSSSDFKWYRRTVALNQNKSHKRLSAYYGCYTDKESSETSFLIFSDDLPSEIIRNINIPIIQEN